MDLSFLNTDSVAALENERGNELERPEVKGLVLCSSDLLCLIFPCTVYVAWVYIGLEGSQD